MRTLLIAGLVMTWLTGCATTDIGPEDAPTPRVPSSRFSAFESVYMKHTTLAPAYQGQSANEAALKKIDENLFKEMGEVFPNLTALPAGNPTPPPAGRTLVIEPHVEKIKFIGGAARVWAGALAGSSAVVLKVTYHDAESGETIADPAFYQRAAAMAGAYSFGAHDNVMLVRIAQVAAEYARKHY